MKFAFCLFKYFPFGGLQRDFLRIAEECLRRGHTVHVYTMAWQGEPLPGVTIHVVSVKKFSNHQRCQDFSETVAALLKEADYDLVVGFNKMQGLDVYYAADPCYVAKVQEQRSHWYRMTARFRTYAALEEAVFNAKAKTEILLIAEREQILFQQFYGTPEERFHILPPGIAQDRRAPTNAEQIRQDLRKDLNIPDGHKLVLMVGSGFKTKGVDRALEALYALPEAEREKTHLYIIGQDNPRLFICKARRLGIKEQVKFLGGRNDVPRFLVGADLLLHPAYYENTGTVLLEALVAGLPVLTTDVCGYADHIERAGAGVVLPSPFLQPELNQQLYWMLSAPDKMNWQNNALAYAANTDLYSLPERAVNLLELFAQERRPVSARPEHNPSITVTEKILFTPSIIAQEEVVTTEQPAQSVTDTAPGEQEVMGIVPKVRDDSAPPLEKRLHKILKINRGFTKNTELPWFKSCLELNDDLKEFWQGKDIFAEIFRQQGQIYREQKTRKTLLFTTSNKSYFIKLHKGVGWREIIKNLLQGRLPILGAHQEWRAILRLHELGINTARLEGFGSRGINPARVKSFVVMEELHNTVSLEDFCRNWPKQPPNPRLKWTLIKEIARIARVLHSNNICHRDFYLCHFLLDITNGLDQLNPNFIRLYLIDLHRMLQAEVFLPKRWIIKDLAGLYFSSLELGLKRRDIFRFLKYYRQTKLAAILPREKDFWQQVTWRAYKLYGKEKLKTLALPNVKFPQNFVLADGGANGGLLMVEQPLRIVPDKRWVVLAQWPQHQVVAKMFLNWRHAQRELEGYEALKAASITTPELLFHGWLAGEKLYTLLFDYIYPAQNYAAIFAENKVEFKQYLTELVQVVARMHAAGIQQTDLHLKNFLLSENTIYVLDPGTIEATTDQQALRESVGLKNMALLLAQLPFAYDQLIEEMYTLYTQTRGIAFTTSGLAKLKRGVKYWRRHRLQKYHDKVLRSTSQLVCRKDWWNFSVCDRDYDSKAMQVFLRNPDAILDTTFAKLLKKGNTCTVGLITIEGEQYVVKRYNIKNFWHGIKRAVTPTRAAKSWCNAQLLQLLELPTAKPVAMMERRCGPLRHTAYFVSEYVEGIKLSEYFNQKHDREEEQQVANNMKHLLRQLAQADISHGDTKATNILLTENNQPVILDLDAMRLHRYHWLARLASYKDWQRFLANWEGRPKILKLFE